MFVGIPTGKYTMRISHSGYGEYIKEINIEKGDNIIPDIILSKTVDTINPTINSIIIFPTNVTPNSMINISVNTTDNIEVIETKADDTKLTNQNGIWNGSITAPSSVGDYTLNITAKDLAGNTDQKSVPYKVVTRQGGASISVVPRSNNITNGNSIDIIIKAKNTQNVDDTFRVYLNVNELPVASRADISWFEWTEKVINIRAGEEITMPMKISIPTGILGTKAFRARVNSTTSTKVYAFDTGYLKIS